MGLVNDPTSSLEIWGDGCPGSYPASPKAMTFLCFTQKVLSALPRSTQLRDFAPHQELVMGVLPGTLREGGFHWGVVEPCG